MLVLNSNAIATIAARTSDLLDRVQRIEAEQSPLRARLEGERQPGFLTAEIVGAAQAAPIIGIAIESFAQAMRAPLSRGRAVACAGAPARGAMLMAP
jgi:hypothetical protein